MRLFDRLSNKVAINGSCPVERLRCTVADLLYCQKVSFELLVKCIC